MTIPQGKYSALAADLPEKDKGNLCLTKKLAMPTEFIAQNGTTIRKSTPISIIGCEKKKTLTRTQKLTAALKLCHKDKNKTKRSKCEQAAHRRHRRVK